MAIAESFARIFYRNAFTIGLPALEIPKIKGKIQERDEIEVDVSNFHCSLFCVVLRKAFNEAF
ncbi:MAG TPA: hypothetical protein VE130_05510 [Nitrososphaeraceae archaeon]|nr:hypothetical protein [Nitrososphaeraceae archaeon]